MFIRTVSEKPRTSTRIFNIPKKDYGQIDGKETVKQKPW